MAASAAEKKRIHLAIDQNDLFNCKSIDNLLHVVKYELPIVSFSGTKLFSCFVSGVNPENKEKYEIPFIVKMVFHNKSLNEICENGKKEKNNKSGIKYTNMADTDIQITEIFCKEFLYGDISPCLLEIIYHKKCDNVKNLAPNKNTCIMKYNTSSSDNSDNILIAPPKTTLHETLCNYAYNIEKGISYDNITFIALMHHQNTLKDYIDNYIENDYTFEFIKVILFLIIYTYYRIKLKYPNFLHSDLHTGNILIRYQRDYNILENRYYKFIYKLNKYFIPTIGILPKIIDFGFSRLPEHNIYSAIEGDKRKITFEQDNDICYLFSRINFLVQNKRCPMLIKLMDAIDIKHTYKRYNKDYLKDNTHMITSIHEMMESPVWDQYKNAHVTNDQVIYTFDK